MQTFIDQSIIEGFIQEALTLLDDALDQITDDATSAEGVNFIFRCLHTLKGSSGFLEFNALSSFVHSFEDFVRDAQTKGTGLNSAETAKIVEGLHLLQEAVSQPTDESIVESEKFADFLKELRKVETKNVSLKQLAELIEEIKNEIADDSEFEPAMLLTASQSLEAILAKVRKKKKGSYLSVAGADIREIIFNGNDITELGVKQINSLEIVAVQGADGLHSLDITALEQELGQLKKILPENVHLLGWDIVVDLCEISPEVVDEFFRRLWTEGIAVTCDVTMADEEEKAPASVTDKKEETSDAVNEPVRREEFFRVSAKIINDLADNIGLLVADRNGMENLIQELRQHMPASLLRYLHDNFSGLDRHINRIERQVTSLNNKKLADIFKKVPGLAAKLAADLDKEVRVTISGEEIEVPRNIIKALNDPFVHIIRNSLDHGIEIAEQRQMSGKPGQGSLDIQARRDDEKLTITVTDDGQGVDPVKIRKKAEKAGLISPADVLSDQEIINLLFAPGFSTSGQVTAVSGRGVGMDVVKSSIEEIDGRISFESTLGQGSKLTIILPVAAANKTRDILLVEVAEQIHGIDYRRVVEVLDGDNITLHDFKGRTFFSYRDTLLKYIDLARLDGSKEDTADQDDDCGHLVVIEDEQKQRVACAIKGIKQKIKVVISGHDHPFIKSNPLIMGSAVVGTGEPFLILDFSDLALFQKCYS